MSLGFFEHAFWKDQKPIRLRSITEDDEDYFANVDHDAEKDDSDDGELDISLMPKEMQEMYRKMQAAQGEKKEELNAKDSSASNVPPLLEEKVGGVFD